MTSQTTVPTTVPTSAPATAPAPDRWRPTPALIGALLCVALLLPFAVLLRRADLIVVATPLVFGTLVPLLVHRNRRSGRAAHEDGGRPVATLTASASTALEGQTLEVSVRVEADRATDLVRVQVRHSDRLVPTTAGPEYCVSPGPDGLAGLDIEVRAERWGRGRVGPAAVSLFAADGMLRRERIDIDPVTVSTLPLRSVFDASDLVPHAAGVVGTHRSRRPGEGTELASIRPFTTGDRLRRITWPVSLRTGALHVVSTLAERDTVVTLVLDTAVEIAARPAAPGTGPGDADRAGGTDSLDTAVHAAATIGEHYLRQGDRVGLIDLGASLRPVRAASGRAHLMNLLNVLLDAEQRRPGRDHEIERLVIGLPARSLVMMFSTLLDARAVDQAVVAARTGHPVIVIDTVPQHPELPSSTPWSPLAWRLAMLRRDATIDRLAGIGVPVVRWRGPGSLDDVLRDLARMAAAPKVLR